jgi:hypothetical protein
MSITQEIQLHVVSMPMELTKVVADNVALQEEYDELRLERKEATHRKTIIEIGSLEGLY